MKQITVEDCMQLKKKFDNYCETAEQHEFPISTLYNIFLIHIQRQYCVVILISDLFYNNRHNVTTRLLACDVTIITYIKPYRKGENL